MHGCELSERLLLAKGLIVDRDIEETALEQIRRRLELQQRLKDTIDPVMAACQESFLAFLPFWTFVNRDKGETAQFDQLWEGQEDLAKVMGQHDWIYALKAGKLGFSELECAYDGWVAMFRQPNARVHIFSRDAQSAEELLGWVRHGLTHLPEWMRLPIAEEERGADTGRSIKLLVSEGDIRQIVRYAAAASVSIDQVCHHAHVDELAHMAYAEKTWNAVQTTIAPGGTCHVVTRGAGENVFAATLWKMAEAGTAQLFPFFRPWTARPDRDQRWYDQHATTLTLQGLHHFAPETPDDALMGDEQNEFIPLELWDRCQEELPPFPPGSKEPAILSLDAAVTGDCFGAVAVTRHPDREEDVAIRAVKLWTPPIDFPTVDAWIRTVCEGGCVAGHPQYEPFADPEGCDACREQILVEPWNIIQVCYDPYQLESMAQTHRRDGVAWWEAFQQGGARLIGDSEFRSLILQRRVAHDGNPLLREHIHNAAAKLDTREDTKLRIVKKSAEKKVDLAVAASMGVSRCLYLSL